MGCITDGLSWTRTCMSTFRWPRMLVYVTYSPPLGQWPHAVWGHVIRTAITPGYTRGGARTREFPNITCPPALYAFPPHAFVKLSELEFLNLGRIVCLCWGFGRSAQWPLIGDWTHNFPEIRCVVLLFPAGLIGIHVKSWEVIFVGDN
jgi:hypothetical protein